MPLAVLVIVFIAVPLAELYVILQVGEAIGAIWTILLLAADSVFGSLLLRSQGRAVWRRFNEALAAGRMPHREVLDGVLVIFGGLLLLTPGFITDVLGLLLLIPPTRALVRATLARAIERRAAIGAAGIAAGRRARPGPRDYDVEGTAHEQPGPGERELPRVRP
jgi:UPF0716 protein FxsA